MMKLSEKLLDALQGYSLVTAESCTGGGIGAAITAISGSSTVYKGGVICYTNWIKEHILGVSPVSLNLYGPVSSQVAEQMVIGVQKLLQADAAISVTGLAGPGGDEYGNAVGMVFVGTAFQDNTTVTKYRFFGSREEVRKQAVQTALQQLLEMII